jgi:protocatechuate 3,4-dioxygenase beta subunit
MQPTRRSVLAALLLAPPTMLSMMGSPVAQVLGAALPPTPECDSDPAETLAQTAGPYYRPSAPLRQNLLGDGGGRQPITLAGYVVDTRCQPIPGAMVEIWHADENGEYDNEGFRLRAHQFADDQGRWGFQTVVTEHYSFRTAHYHFRVHRPSGAVLTTQLYFPDHPLNEGDPLFDPRLLLDMQQGGTVGRFDFVLA